MNESGAETEASKLPKFMLRLDDGTPVTVEYKSPGWEIDRRLGVRREGISESFNPRFKNPLSGNTLIEINIAREPLLFLVGGGHPKSERPDSVYVFPINRQKFDELKSGGYKVVSPDNLPHIKT